jgi:hypothetical protein
MTNQKPFQKFEALAQQLVEGSFSRLFGGGVSLSTIARALALKVEDETVAGWAPAQYEIRLNPADFDRLRQAEPEMMSQLTNYVGDLARQAALTLTEQPHLVLLADPAIPKRELMVAALDTERLTDATTQIRQVTDAGEGFAAEIAALDAYLIVDGQRHVPLVKSVTSLGRSVENDIVLDAPTVSRQHAQIRWRYGRFILYDVSRRNRTLVNSQVINETVLKSGDVISLSDVKLIYGEGETQQRPRSRSASNLNDETQIRPPANANS